MATIPRIKPEAINIDLSRRAVVYETPANWLATPMPGVDRRYLERDGGESARWEARTTLTRYTPYSDEGCLIYVKTAHPGKVKNSH